MNRNKKYTLAEVKKIFRDEGCELREKEYVNCSIKMRYICECGRTSKISLKKFIKGQRCRGCSNNRKSKWHYYCYEEVKKYFEEHNCELLEEKYKSCNDLMKYRCECRNISYIRFNDFLKGGRCKECAKKKRASKLKLIYKDVKKYFEDHNCKLLSKEYVNNLQRLDYICECGNEDKISLASFKRGSRCKECKIKKIKEKQKHSYEYIKEFLEKNNYILLSEEYQNARSVLFFICDCGGVGNTTFDNFRKGVRCRECYLKKISGKNNYNYDYNKTNEERIRERSYREYIKWRNEIYERDRYTCQCCGKTNCYLNAHHIKNYSSNKELRLEESNGITLCEDCHKKFHKKYSKKNNNKKQLNEFLKLGNKLVLFKK